MVDTVTLVERAQRSAAETDTWRQPLVPVHNPAVFDGLVRELSRIAAQDPGKGLVMLVDSVTAAGYIELESARAIADTVWVCGEIPAEWDDAPNVCASKTTAASAQDRFVILLSSYQSIALLNGNASGQGYHAGWSAVRGQVRSLAQSLLAEHSAKVPLPGDQPTDSDKAMVAMARLAATQTSLLTAAERTIRLEDNDLVYVLDILKAISAKRRSHDILFVFVEQIARVISVDRCSVVRVWGGGDSTAHVLASHEDAGVEDLVIDLSRYPELNRAIYRQEKVVIDDVSNDGLTESFKDELAAAGIQSLLVVPIVLYDENVGTLLLRAARKSGSFSPREINFCEIVCEAASNALERAHLFDVIQQTNKRLEHLATTDGLTGIHNHRFFSDRLEEEFVRAQRYNTPLSCLLFDIDDFKQINDTFGHLVGDEVLRELASRVAQTNRQNDTFARYGGEEFAVILPHSGDDGSMHKAEAIREAISAEPFPQLPADHPVTVSIGIGVYNRETMTTYQNLLRQADDNLYEAKRSGKNRVVIGHA